MLRRTSLLLLCAAPVMWAAVPALAGAPQETGIQPLDPTVRPPLAQNREQRAAEIEASLDGAWRMTRFVHVDEPLSDTKVDGVTIFRQGFGATVVQAENWNTDFQGFEEFFQAMAFNYRVNEVLRLQTSTILGHNVLDDVVELEQKLAPREFNIDVLGDTLILTRPDGTRIQYQRLVNDAFPEKTLLLIQQQRGRSVQPVPGVDGR